MPLSYFSPVSMKALNENIDENLIMTQPFGWIRKSQDDGALSLLGATNGSQFAGNGSRITLTGEDSSIIGYSAGSIIFEVPWGTPTSSFCIPILSLLGSTNDPYARFITKVDFNDKKLMSVADPTVAQDAATKNYVDTTLGLGTQGDLTVSAPIAISNATRHLIGGAAALSLVNDAAGTITEIDTGALNSSDTRIATSKSIKDYSDLNLDLALTRSITGTYLKKSDDLGYLNINGGSSSYGGAQLQIFSSGYGSGINGNFRFYVPNAAASGLVLAMQIVGLTNTPTIDFNYNRVVNVGSPTTIYDAINYIPWTTSTSLGHTWGTATPASWGYTFRYTQIGRTCYFVYYGASADSNGTTALTITGLPFTAQSGVNWFLSGIEAYGAGGGTYKHPLPYIPAGTSQIAFLAFSAGTDANAISIQLTGFYEF
jgi:hypothetical protein